MTNTYLDDIAVSADAAAEEDPAETGVAATVAPEAVVAILDSIG